MLSDIDYVEKVNTVHTNIIMFKLKSTVDPETFIEYLANNNVNAVYFGENKVRFVTHLNVDVKILEPLRVILNNFKV
jgi:threonine aldolase